MSLDATARVRSCGSRAGPAITREGERLRYRLPKPRADGQSVLELTPFELLDRLAVLIPPPRRHRHRYNGVLAPVCP